jgi:Zn-dependent protease with chaperone function
VIYNNLIYVLVVMVILATGSTSELPALPGYQVFFLFILKAWLFRQTVRFSLARQKIRRLPDYFSTERNFAVLALFLFGLDVYLFDLQYYLGFLPLADRLPFLADLAGIVVFLFYMVLLWGQLKQSYEAAVGVRKNTYSHIRDQLRICIALILPWLVVNFLHDLLLLAPIAQVQEFMASPWGEPLFLLVMVVAAVLWFPVVMVRLLGCVPLPDGSWRRQVEKFCRQQNVRFGEICLWPIVEGKVFTAGVVGLVGRFRYLMITPALLDALAEDELQAVVAHEIGHVKKYHLLLYLLLFIGFGLLLQLCVGPMIYLLLGTRFFYGFLLGYEGELGTVVTILAGVPVVILTIIYFRYVFGFFMRNFERQADLYSLRVMGSAAPLIRVFRKIAILSGNDRDKPCWHHFSVGQRIDYLLSCDQDGKRLKDHNYKVYACLAGYFLAISVALVVTWRIGDQIIASSAGQRTAEEVILEKIESDPGNSLWHQFHGDLLVARGQYAEAIKAFEQSLQLYPDNPETLNNLAWLLLTVEQKKLSDPVRALDLVQKAVAIQARSHILDTLAEAYWQNGMVDLAIATEQRALDSSPDNKEYYRRQLEKFSLKNSS